MIIQIALGILTFYAIIFGAAAAIGILLGLGVWCYEIIIGLRSLILKLLGLKDTV